MIVNKIEEPVNPELQKHFKSLPFTTKHWAPLRQIFVAQNVKGVFVVVDVVTVDVVVIVDVTNVFISHSDPLIKTWTNVKYENVFNLKRLPIKPVLQVQLISLLFMIKHFPPFLQTLIEHSNAWEANVEVVVVVETKSISQSVPNRIYFCYKTVLKDTYKTVLSQTSTRKSGITNTF